MTNTGFKYNNIEKINKNFMYNDLRRSNCYNSNFTNSNFNYVSFRGAHFKSCDFYGCTFNYSEFIGSNLKKSKFKNAIFENAIFEGVNLEGVDFKGVKFKNVIFLDTDISKASNIKAKKTDIRIYDEIPSLEMSENLKEAIENAMKNEHIKKSRVLDNKEGKVNLLSMMILLENFDEETLIKGLNKLSIELDKDFCTLSYIIKTIENYKIKDTII